MLRNIVSINGRDFLLAQNTPIGLLKDAVREAFTGGGDFVDFTVVGNREVSVFLTPGVAVVFESSTVDYDSRDTGDLAYPYDDLDDYIA